MKAIIIYESTHHGNIKKFVDAIAEKHEIVTVDISIQKEIHLEEYDFIGFASGKSFSRFYERITACAQEKLPTGKQVFFLYTCANNSKDFSENIKQIAKKKGAMLWEHMDARGLIHMAHLK